MLDGINDGVSFFERRAARHGRINANIARIDLDDRPVIKIDADKTYAGIFGGRLAGDPDMAACMQPDPAQGALIFNRFLFHAHGRHKI